MDTFIKIKGYSNSRKAQKLTKLKIFVVAENKAVGIMKPGHTFTIEPMISQGKDDR